MIVALAGTASAQYPGWGHSGSFYVLTTPEGADLPATASEADFPLLLRLDKANFDFSQAKPDGEDLRFSAAGKPLAYQIEEWDAGKSTATVWVRIPEIKGNARQEIRIHSGKADAASESSGAAVFNESNGYASVWHMTGPVEDEVGTVESTDLGTTATAGMIGPARHFAGKKGISGGDKITGYPSGVGPMSTEAWFRAEQTGCTVLGWGENKNTRAMMMRFGKPARAAMASIFADVAGKSTLAKDQWYHVVHTYAANNSSIYVNGVLDGAAGLGLDLPTLSHLWIGGWYDKYDFVGDIDEVRISKVARSADWISLQYENQKPLQTLAGLW